MRGASRGVREGEGGKVFGICVVGISGKRFFVRRIENMILSRRFLRTAALAAVLALGLAGTARTRRGRVQETVTAGLIPLTGRAVYRVHQIRLPFPLAPRSPILAELTPLPLI